jgi:O-antigen/teichoic acid export membrane protein
MSEQQPLSPWHYKPWWCQPWSILLTGILIISGSWLVFKTIWITVIIAIPILTWMGFFLLIWPQMVIRSGILQSYQNDSMQQ